MNLTGRLATLCTIVDYKTVTSLLVRDASFQKEKKGFHLLIGDLNLQNFCKYFASTRPYPDAFSRSKLNVCTGFLMPFSYCLHVIDIPFFVRIDQHIP